MEEDKLNSVISTPQMKRVCNTPKRTLIKQQFGTPLQRLKGIKEDSPSKDEKTTPVISNPFEVNAESLYFSSYSPSVFATFARNKNDSGNFRWSIDHVSVLYPAEIDETSIPNLVVDPETEMKAQKAIDTFFSQNSIVPSPWSTDSAERRECKYRRSRCSVFDIDTNEASTQTMVTIPPNVDLVALLGKEFVYNDENNSCHVSPNSSSCSSGSFRESDAMNISSLRRKLFVADDNSKTPLSRPELKDLCRAKQWCTPVSSSRSIQSTPSDLLASSPITPPNCSGTCNSCESPQMSPIIPSSQRSLRMRSFNERLDEESNCQFANQKSSEYMDAKSEISMSFCVDSENASTFQFNASQKQDTGYVTSSMNSMQNVTSDNTSFFPAQINPITEYFGDFRNGGNIADMSSVNEGMSIDEDKFELIKHQNDSLLYGSTEWSLVPNNCSTPAFNNL